MAFRRAYGASTCAFAGASASNSVAGTDIEYDDKYRLQDEIVEFVRVGLAPMAAIKSATSVAAECLTINARTGSIRPGMEADLIVVERDPLADIEMCATIPPLPE